MILNISQEAYFPSFFAGVNLFVHDPRDIPSPSSHQIAAPPGFISFISLIPTRVKFLPKPYKSYGEDYCVESTEMTSHGMKWHKEYTWFGCVEECLITIAVSQCNCTARIRGFPEFLSDRFCSPEEVQGCIYPNINRHMTNILSQNDTSCQCPQPCESIRYDIRTSLMAFPSKSVAKFLVQRGAAPSYQNLRDNYMSIYISFEQMLLHHMEHVPEIDHSDIFSRLGGQMGLFLGASLLTLMELSEVIFMSLLVLAKAVLGSWTGLRVGAR